MKKMKKIYIPMDTRLNSQMAEEDERDHWDGCRSQSVTLGFVWNPETRQPEVDKRNIEWPSGYLLSVSCSTPTAHSHRTERRNLRVGIDKNGLFIHVGLNEVVSAHDGFIEIFQTNKAAKYMRQAIENAHAKGLILGSFIVNVPSFSDLLESDVAA